MSRQQDPTDASVQEAAGRPFPAKQFDHPAQSLEDLDTVAAATLIAAATDVALILDEDGVIRDLAFGSEELSREGYGKWLGQPWIETVTSESRAKIEALLREASGRAAPRWRHVNHPSSLGADVPVLYSAMRVGRRGRTIAVGRDLRSIAVLQQRLVEAQQALERDYWRLRNAETRYRLLFQLASEAVLIVDASTQKLMEYNPAASRLLEDTRRLVGRPVTDLFDAEGGQALQALFTAVRAAGRGDEILVRPADGGRELNATASLFQQENAALFLIRLWQARADAAVDKGARPRSLLLGAVENSPDGYVVTDPDGHILAANTAFVQLAQLASEEQARGESLDRWLGRPGVDLKVMIANLRQRGSIQLFATTLQSEFGPGLEVEISAVSVPHGERPVLGFAIRPVGRRLATDPARAAGAAMPRSVEQLTQLVGRVSLKDLVRESTDMVERLCIEAALELTGDNRASAAEMLGLSRQSLYVKMHRYGLGDLGSDNG